MQAPNWLIPHSQFIFCVLDLRVVEEDKDELEVILLCVGKKIMQSETSFYIAQSLATELCMNGKPCAQVVRNEWTLGYSVQVSPRIGQCFTAGQEGREVNL